MAVFPSVDLTNFDLAPAVRRVRNTGDAITAGAVDVTKDAAYTAIGLGILTFQRIQVRRREIEKSLRG